MKLKPLDKKQLNDLITKHTPALMKNPKGHPYNIGGLQNTPGAKTEAFLRPDGKVVFHIDTSASPLDGLAKHTWFTFDMKGDGFLRTTDVRHGANYEDT